MVETSKDQDRKQRIAELEKRLGTIEVHYGMAVEDLAWDEMIPGVSVDVAAREKELKEMRETIEEVQIELTHLKESI